MATRSSLMSVIGNLICVVAPQRGTGTAGSRAALRRSKPVVQLGTRFRRLIFRRRNVESVMPKLRIKTGDWVVVCDGAKALILENAGDSVFPNLRTKEVHTQPDPPTREQGTDAPGRAFQSVGT